MRILVLGGTSFVGRALAVEAVARSYEVTLLNRGTKPAPEGTKSLIGDRLQPDGLAALKNFKFDAVVDTWSGDPVAVSRAVEKLFGQVGLYLYISSCSVYDHEVIERGRLYDESTRLFDVDAPDARKLEYQFNKRSAEIAIEKSGIPSVLMRPGVILGPHEATIIERGRLTWWLTRLHRGGRTLAPNPRDMTLQLVDVRDLVNFAILTIEKHLLGAFNIVEQPGYVSMGQFLETANQTAGGRAELIWKEPKEIIEAGIEPWTELPLWVNPDSLSESVMYSWDTSKAKLAGLRCRPYESTIKDTWSWMQDGELRPVPISDSEGKPIFGLSPEKEAKILD